MGLPLVVFPVCTHLLLLEGAEGANGAECSAWSVNSKARFGPRDNLHSLKTLT